MSRMERLEQFVHLLLVATAVGVLLVLVLTSCSEKDHDCFDGCGDTQEAGDTGEHGETGEAGASCSVAASVGDCYNIQCGSTSARLCNGTPGTAGEQGERGSAGAIGERGVPGVAGAEGVDATGITLVTPCPDTAGTVPYPERFIRFADGTVVAFYADPSWDRQRLVTLISGATYVTTDGRNCRFIAE